MDGFGVHIGPVRLIKFASVKCVNKSLDSQAWGLGYMMRISNTCLPNSVFLVLKLFNSSRSMMMLSSVCPRIS